MATATNPITEAAAIPIAAAQPEQMNLFSKAVLLDISFGKFGNRKKVGSDKVAETVQTDADKSRLSMSKKLLESPEIKAIDKIDSDIRKFLDDRCIESPFRAGVRFIPYTMVEQVDAGLCLYKAGRERAVSAFLEVYERLVQDAQADLANDFFNAADYPKREDLEKRYTLDWQYREMATPQGLKAISTEIFKRETEKAQAEVEEAVREIREGLRAGMAKLVDYMVARLKPDEDGKVKTFRDGPTEKFVAFLATFDARNVIQDGELQRLASTARQLLEGTTPDKIRESDTLRSKIATGMETIQKELNSMVVDRPVRSFKDVE